MSFNKVILVGNLTRDPEVAYTPKGTAIAKFSLAVNERRKNEAGEPIDEVLFIDVTAFGTTAETIAKYFAKGWPILVDGKLKQDKWTDKQTGQMRTKFGVVMNSFAFIGKKEGGESSQEAPAPRRAPVPAPRGPAPEPQEPAAPAPRLGDEDETLPF